jgi:hypothetical protein
MCPAIPRLCQSAAWWTAGLVLGVIVAPGAAAEPGEGPKLRLTVPAYFYPADAGLKPWDRLIEAAGRVPVVAIVNPDSGPGAKADANYTAVIGRARKGGVTLVGYVTTSYARRPLAEVKAEVDRWLELYPGIHGILFDEQASAAGKVGYYAELYDYVRKKLPAGLVVGNPGTVCAADYVARPAADVVCLFEGGKGFDAFRPPAWADRYPARRFAAVAYQVETAKQMEEYLHEALRRRIGLVYITDARGANPYDRLPSYWDAEVAAVRRANEGKAP